LRGGSGIIKLLNFVAFIFDWLIASERFALHQLR
jgi:hypothetical protein